MLDSDESQGGGYKYHDPSDQRMVGYDQGKSRRYQGKGLPYFVYMLANCCERTS